MEFLQFSVEKPDNLGEVNLDLADLDEICEESGHETRADEVVLNRIKLCNKNPWVTRPGLTDDVIKVLVYKEEDSKAFWEAGNHAPVGLVNAAFPSTGVHEDLCSVLNMALNVNPVEG